VREGGEARFWEGLCWVAGQGGWGAVGCSATYPPHTHTHKRPSCWRRSNAQGFINVTCPCAPQFTHFVQLYRSGQFVLYDYGSPEANQRAYGAEVPPVVTDLYPCLRGLPVDIMAGSHDGIISPDNVWLHYEAMIQAGGQLLRVRGRSRRGCRRLHAGCIRAG